MLTQSIAFLHRATASWRACAASVFGCTSFLLRRPEFAMCQLTCALQPARIRRAFPRFRQTCTTRQVGSSPRLVSAIGGLMRTFSSPIRSEHSQPSRRCRVVRSAPFHVPIRLLRALRDDHMGRLRCFRDISERRRLLPLLKRVLSHLQRALSRRTYSSPLTGHPRYVIAPGRCEC